MCREAVGLAWWWERLGQHGSGPPRAGAGAALASWEDSAGEPVYEPGGEPVACQGNVAEAWRILDRGVSSCQVLANLCDGLEDPKGDVVLEMVRALADGLGQALALLGGANCETREAHETERVD